VRNFSMDQKRARRFRMLQHLAGQRGTPEERAGQFRALQDGVKDRVINCSMEQDNAGRFMILQNGAG
jgi:hypothetical protein